MQKNIENLRIGLLNFVQQNHGIGTTAHRLGQLTALLVAHVPRRGTDKTRHRVLFGVLGHVNTYHRALIVEEELRERLGQLRLTHARRAEEKERTGRTVRVR